VAKAFNAGINYKKGRTVVVGGLLYICISNKECQEFAPGAANSDTFWKPI
jgi:hypothetical protein